MPDDPEISLRIDDYDDVYLVTDAPGLHRVRCLGHLSEPDILEAVPPELFDELFAAVDAYNDGFDPGEEARYTYDSTRGNP